MLPGIRRSALVALSVCAVSVACGHHAPIATGAADRLRPARFTLAGQFSIPALTVFPPGTRLRFGGISGIAATTVPGEYLGISDAQTDSRVYRLRVSGTGSTFQFAPIDHIALETSADGPDEIDPESIAVTSNGHMFIVSEGVGNVEPRLPPALLEFGPRGAFIRQLPVRDRYVPNPSGPLVKGVRSNVGFESLTLSPAGDALFLATESAIVQDGELTSFERGAPARILEYSLRAGRFEPAREFVYMVEPIYKPPFGAGLAVNGLVELMALEDGSLLALERSYVAETGDTGRGMNRIRLFHISLARATDVSAFDSLKDAPDPVPVSKVKLLDLSNVPGLSPELAPSLDNFEAMAFGPRLQDGRRSLMLVSDDNFNQTQRTWFLLFALDVDPFIQRIQ
jgi:hypothetical protein